MVPSLPGFGFSEAPKTPGYGVAKNAEIINTLMVKLGYTKYGKRKREGKGKRRGKAKVVNLQQNCQYYTVVIGEQLLANTSPRDTRITAARSIHVYHSAYHRCQHPGTSSFIHSRLPNSSVACYSALIECMDRERSFWMVQRLRMLSYMTDAVTELFKVQDHIPWHMALPTARWASWVRKQWTESSGPPSIDASITQAWSY